MKLILPMPPSINQTYGISRFSMYKRKPVKDWERTAGYEILSQRKCSKDPFTGSVIVNIEWYYNAERDIDAGIKVLLDLFQKMNIYLNDSQVHELHVTKCQDTMKPRVEAEINEIS